MRCVSKPFQGQKQATDLRGYRSTNARQIVLQTQKTTEKTGKKTNLDFLNTFKLDDCLRKLLTKFPKRDHFHGLWEKMKRHVVVTTADCTYQFIKIIKKEKFCQMCKTFTGKTRDSLHSHKPLPQDHHCTINTRKDAPVKFEFVEEKVSVALSTYFYEP